MDGEPLPFKGLYLSEMLSNAFSRITITVMEYSWKIKYLTSFQHELALCSFAYMGLYSSIVCDASGDEI